MQPESKFTCARHINFPWTYRGTKYSLTIQLPDLGSNSFQCLGDWGPTFVTPLKEDQLVYFSCVAGGMYESHSCILRPKHAVFSSPPQAEERGLWPYRLELEDLAVGVRISLRLDQNGVVDDVQLRPIDMEQPFLPTLMKNVRKPADLIGGTVIQVS